MKATDRVSIGTTGSRTVEVTHEMTVAHFHEHMPAVFGTPIMIYHMEVAAADAVHEFLPQGWISVGVAVDVKHLAATPVGRESIEKIGEDFTCAPPFRWSDLRAASSGKPKYEDDQVEGDWANIVNIVVSLSLLEAFALEVPLAPGDRA